MKLSYTPYELTFRHPFGVSGHLRTSTMSVFLRITAENREGYGEACLPAYLGETVEDTIAFFKKTREFLRQYDPTLPLHFFLDEIDSLDPGCNAAKAAVDIALHDLYARLHNCSYSDMMGMKQSEACYTSYTIGIDGEEKTAQKIAEAEQFKILKIKAGTEDDKKLISMVRKLTDKPLIVDVNQGWNDPQRALDLLCWMEGQNVLLVEQPLPKDMHEDMRWLTEESPVPTFADESVKRLSDLERMDRTFSGINIKLMKCTGLREAMRMIAYCKKNRIGIMLGCMAESSCATTAMAQLMQFADYVDLDAPLLYTNDPFEGVVYEAGKLSVKPGLGTGALPKSGIFA